MSTQPLPAIAGVVIKKDGKYLLVQEKQPKVYGLWNLPAGKVDPGESLEQAAIREAKEEVGYVVKLLRKIDIFNNQPPESSIHAFEAEIIDGNLNFPQDEILDAQWFSSEEIDKMKAKIRHPWVIEAINYVENNPYQSK
ncbi:MAG: NUDIX hydrolase [Candidatus Shapirobacteria bacterium]|jgi:NADH pyrophosphatase NudC (nudix superfamily)